MGRMEELVALLNKYAKEYYEQDNPTVSDAEYDALYDELDRYGLWDAFKRHCNNSAVADFQNLQERRRADY